MQVDNIETGTVIDHIKAGNANRVMKLLGVYESYPHRIAIVQNVPSKKMKLKDIVKIEGKIVQNDDANLIALVSPEATVNVIRNGKLEKKHHVRIPNEIKGRCRCPNPNCISNAANTWMILDHETEFYRCHYCERVFGTKEIVP